MKWKQASKERKRRTIKFLILYVVGFVFIFTKLFAFGLAILFLSTKIGEAQIYRDIEKRLKNLEKMVGRSFFKRDNEPQASQRKMKKESKKLKQAKKEIRKLHKSWKKKKK